MHKIHASSNFRCIHLPRWAFLEFLLHKLTIGHSYSSLSPPTPFWKDSRDWKSPRLKGLESFDWHGERGGGAGWLVDSVYPSSRDCSLMCGFNDQHTGQKHFAQCLFSCLALTNKVYGSSMENVCCFSFFFCFCLKFERLNYCKHSLFLCLRYWMENSIVYCWTVLEIFGQMCVKLAVPCNGI